MSLPSLLRISFVVDILKHKANFCEIMIELVIRIKKGLFPRVTIQSKPCKEVLGSLRRDNLNRFIIAQMNINSIRNKFDLLTEELSGNIDVIIISETKIDETFPAKQFDIDGYTPPID